MQRRGAGSPYLPDHGQHIGRIGVCQALFVAVRGPPRTTPRALAAFMSALSSQVDRATARRLSGEPELWCRRPIYPSGRTTYIECGALAPGGQYPRKSRAGFSMLDTDAEIERWISMACDDGFEPATEFALEDDDAPPGPPLQDDELLSAP